MIRNKLEARIARLEKLIKEDNLQTNTEYLAEIALGKLQETLDAMSELITACREEENDEALPDLEVVYNSMLQAKDDLEELEQVV